MEILKESTRIVTKIGKIEGLITGICIRNQQSYYEMSYFVNGAHCSCWIYRYEFDVMPEPKAAGFNYSKEIIVLKDQP